jgi:hypothetical protein
MLNRRSPTNRLTQQTNSCHPAAWANSRTACPTPPSPKRYPGHSQKIRSRRPAGQASGLGVMLDFTLVYPLYRVSKKALVAHTLNSTLLAVT